MKNSIFNAVCKTRYLALLVVLIFTCGNAWGADATMGGGNSSCTVNNKSAKRAGTSSAAGSMTITVPNGAKVLSFYCAAWNGESPTVSITPAAKVETSSFSPSSDSGISGSGSNFTLSGTESSYLRTISLNSITSETTLTFANSAKKKRFVVWGAKYVFNPTSLTNTTVGSTTATLGWSYANSTDKYEVYYSTSNTAPTATTTPSIGSSTIGTTKSADLTGLTAGTTYYWWVRAVDDYCKSAWVAGTSFTTASASCDKKVTITKGTPETGGSFTLDKTGNQDCCSALTVTVSNITAPSGKQFSAITQTGIAAANVTIDQSAKTVTYAANSNGSSTINVTFVDLPKYTVTLKDDDTELTQASYGASVTLPSRAGCSGYTFAGWSTTNNTSWTTTAPTIIPAGNYTPTANENLYPVYTKTEGGGTTETTVTETFTNQTSHSSVTDWKQTLTWDASESNASIEWTTYYGKITSGYTEIRTYNDNVMGYLWTSEPITGLKKVKFKGWHVTDTDAANMVVSYSTDNDTWYELGTHAATSDNSTFSDEFEITSSDPSTAYYLSIDLSDATCPSSGNKKYRIDDIVITTETGGGSTTYYISVPNCCTDWSTPTVSYSSSLAIGATATVTISSGTTHGAVTYESSNEDILTVESDGTITAVGAGTAHIIATWAGDATYCGKSANSNDITVSGIEITGTLPVNFGQVYQNAVIGDKTLSVTGLGLTSAIIPSLPSGSPFSVSPASLAKDCSGATLTISASTATIGEYSHTLTLTSGSFTATATINMNVIAMPSCTFVDNLHNLTVDKNGVSLSNYDLTAAAGTSVVFPVLANQEKGVSTCEEQHYVFVGWTTSDDNDHPENHLVTSHTLANDDDITYYAVWADGVAGVSYTKLTSSTFKTSPTKYVIGADDGEGTDLFFYSCEKTDQNNSWGYVSSDPSTDAPIQFTLSGSASELVVASTETTTRYLQAASGKQFFGMSSSSTTVVLGSGGTIESTADTYNNLRYNSQGGLRWYTGTSTGTAAYFYEVVAGSTPSYRTSCCANKVPAPTVTATMTSTTITLNWNDLSGSGATGYEVSWNSGAWTSTSGSRTYTASGLTPNTSYSWQVRATYTDPKCGADIASGSTTTNQVYHVTYAKGDENANCNATGSTTDDTAYEAGAAVTLQGNEFSLKGYTFNEWTTDDPDVTISNNQITMPDHDVVITATWTAVVDKYFDRMHDQTDASHGGIEETSGVNEGKYYIAREGCNYNVPTATDRATGDACQTSHYKLRGWIAASYMKGYPNNMTGEIGTGNESHIFEPTGTKTATGATYYAIWAEVVE